MTRPDRAPWTARIFRSWFVQPIGTLLCADVVEDGEEIGSVAMRLPAERVERIAQLWAAAPETERERDELQLKVARAAHRLGLEANAWEALADHIEEPGEISIRSIHQTATARAASLEAFVRDELGATEPAVTIPTTLATRLLRAIPDRPCCGDVLEGRCYCPRGTLRHQLETYARPTGDLDPAVEDETHRLRRLAGR